MLEATLADEEDRQFLANDNIDDGIENLSSIIVNRTKSK